MCYIQFNMPNKSIPGYLSVRGCNLNVASSITRAIVFQTKEQAQEVACDLNKLFTKSYTIREL